MRGEGFSYIISRWVRNIGSGPEGFANVVEAKSYPHFIELFRSL